MSLTTVGEIFGALIAVGAVLYHFFKWQPIRKPWCVVLYLVSRDTNAKFSWPDYGGASAVNALDVKLDEVVGVLNQLPCASTLNFVKTLMLGTGQAPQDVDWENVHVVYRALWNQTREKGRKARARIVTWRPGAPSVADDESFAEGADDDRNGFFKWVYDKCHADHYAVFFWGHSVGPGGLFNLGNSVEFPPLPSTSGWTTPASLIDVEETLKILQDIQANGALTIGLPLAPASIPPSGQSPATAGTGSLTGSTNPSTRKVDVVLFQSCWMSTLETAFQLQDVARYIVASQSPVPIGYSYASGSMSAPTGPIWPYERIIGKLLASPANFIGDVVAELRTFFGDPAARAPFSSATVSVLDLGEGQEVSTIVRPAVARLVDGLALISPIPGYEGHRQTLLGGGGKTYGESGGDLTYGDWALRDLRMVCLFLKDPNNHPAVLKGSPASTALVAAATKVLTVTTAGGTPYSLVNDCFVIGPVSSLNIFQGISLMWMPAFRAAIPPNDMFIADQINFAFYEDLRLVTETVPAGAAAGESWATYAFEQLT